MGNILEEMARDTKESVPSYLIAIDRLTRENEALKRENQKLKEQIHDY